MTLVLIVFGIPLFLMVFFCVIAWAFEAEKCPKCGERMDVFFNEETMDFEYECSKCGKKMNYDSKKRKEGKETAQLC